MACTVSIVEADEVIDLGDVMRSNVRRLRELRGLTVRGLAEGRLKPLGSPITGSTVSKIESGARSISVEDWTALSIGLRAPMTAFVLVPRHDDWTAWSPRQEDREWVVGVEWVAVAQGILVHRDHTAAWLSGEAVARDESGRALVGEGEWQEYLSAAPAAQRVREELFRQPTLLALGTLEAALMEVLAGGSGSRAGWSNPIEVTREGMAAHLGDSLERLSDWVRPLVKDVLAGRTPGVYMDEPDVPEGKTHA
jgi:transcriptional regulator with XRE-family HTH domain